MMTEAQITAMLDEIMSEAALQAALEVDARANQLHHEMAHVRHEPLLTEITNRAASRLSEGVVTALARLAHIFESRPARWHWAHKDLIRSFDEYHELTASGIATVLGSRPMFDLEVGTLWGANKSRMHSRILAHSAGQTAPKPKPWHERNWLLATLTSNGIAFVSGVGATLLVQYLSG